MVEVVKPLQPQTVDEYLATLSADKRAALKRVRKMIASVAPAAEECIKYGIPTFLLNGKMLVSFSARANFCSFHAGAHPIRAHHDELAAFDLGIGTIRFRADRPLPDGLLRKLLKTRVAERASGH